MQNQVNAADGRTAGGIGQTRELPAMLSVDDVGALLACSPRHVYRLADMERIPRPVKLGALVRWSRASIETWIAQGCSSEFISADALAKLPKNSAALVSQAIQLFRFYENKTGLTFSPIFVPLLGPLDRCAQDMVFDRLVHDIPKKEQEQEDHFNPYMRIKDKKRASYLFENAKRIQKLLVYNAAIMPIGVLRFCLEYAESPADGIGGVFASIRKNFTDLRRNGLSALVDDVYSFRNTCVAHQEKELTELELARGALKKWVDLVVHLEALFVSA